MAGYIGAKQGVTQVDGYNRSEADAEFVNDPNDVIAVSGGNVGIGTSSPTQKLDVRGNIAATDGTKDARINDDGSLELTRDDGIAYIDFRSAIAEDFDCRIQQASDGLAFQTGGNGSTAERMRIDSSGNLLVGTTSSPSGSTGGSCFQVNSGNRRTLILATTEASGTMAGFFNTNGLVGNIGVSGSSTSYNTSSDYRLKEDVQPMSGASDRLMALKPVNFAWKVDGTRVDGFLAHETQEIVPEAVTGEKDAVDKDGKPEYQGIDQAKLVPLLTAALQEALTEIADLKTRVAALEGN